MKKIIYCLTALLMVLAACGNKESQNNEQSTTSETVEGASTGESNQRQEAWPQQNTIKSNKPMVVDFFATWCGPCKELAPILDQAEKNHQGEIIFKRIDVDQEQELAQEFQVQAIPMLMFITPSGEYKTMVGLQSPEDIESMIQTLLARSGSAV